MTKHIGKLLPVVRSALANARSNLLELCGLCAIAYGIGMIFVPAGVIFFGMALCFLGYALDRSPSQVSRQ